MIKKLLLSVAAIAAVIGLAFGATQAFFSDSETSTGNVLVAGALDLKIDNTCYYNGLACRPVLGPDDRELGYSTWSNKEGRSGDPNGERCSCTWTKKDLGEGDVFFDLHDLKPGDWEEDTISLSVENPSWVCARATLTKNDDFSCTEPELADDPSCTDPGAPGDADAFDGELAQNLQFVFWYDDGDNVLETDEEEGIIRQGQGPAISVLGASWPIADSSTGGGPIPGDKTVYIGKAFCFGKLTLDPVIPGDENSPTIDPGIDCDGKLVDNASQTDIATANIVFEAIQARHNDNFICSLGGPTSTPTPTSTTPTNTPTPTPTSTLTPTPTPGSSIANHLVINEVMFDPPNPNACGTEGDAEWVEIYNPTGSSVNLDTWSVGDTLFTDDLPNVLLPAGGFAIVSNCAQSSFNTIWPLPGGTIYIDLSSVVGGGLNNGGEHIRLLDGATLVDGMSYGSNTDAFSPSVVGPVADHSLERNPDGVDTNTAADFVDRTTPTPGT